MIAGNIILNNESKALVGERSIWGKDRISMQLVTSPVKRAYILKFANKYLPEDGSFGVRKLPLFYEYVLLGGNQSRKIIWLLDNPSVFNKQWLEDHEVEFLLLDDADFPPQDMPAWFTPFEARKGWTIYAIN